MTFYCFLCEKGFSDFEKFHCYKCIECNSLTHYCLTCNNHMLKIFEYTANIFKCGVCRKIALFIGHELVQYSVPNQSQIPILPNQSFFSPINSSNILSKSENVKRKLNFSGLSPFNAISPIKLEQQQGTNSAYLNFSRINNNNPKNIFPQNLSNEVMFGIGNNNIERKNKENNEDNSNISNNNQSTSNNNQSNNSQNTTLKDSNLYDAIKAQIGNEYYLLKNQEGNNTVLKVNNNNPLRNMNILNLFNSNKGTNSGGDGIAEKSDFSGYNKKK